MDISKVRESVPAGVAVVALDGSVETDFEINAEEEQLVSTSAVPGRVAEFRLGRRAAHMALAEIGESGPVLRGPRRDPVWPDGVVGSISHCGNIAMAAVALDSDAGGIGVDLEDRSRFFPELEEQIALEDERTALDRLEGMARESAALEMFSAKETIYKAVYPRVGRFFGFDAARIEFATDHLVGYFTEPVDPRYPVGRPMRIDRLWDSGTLLTWLVLPTD